MGRAIAIGDAGLLRRKQGLLEPERIQRRQGDQASNSDYYYCWYDYITTATATSTTRLLLSIRRLQQTMLLPARMPLLRYYY